MIAIKKVVVGLYDSQLLLAESHHAWTSEISGQIARISLQDDIEDIVDYGVQSYLIQYWYSSYQTK